MPAWPPNVKAKPTGCTALQRKCCLCRVRVSREVRTQSGLRQGNKVDKGQWLRNTGRKKRASCSDRTEGSPFRYYATVGVSSCNCTGQLLTNTTRQTNCGQSDSISQKSGSETVMEGLTFSSRRPSSSVATGRVAVAASCSSVLRGELRKVLQQAVKAG